MWICSLKRSTTTLATSFLSTPMRFRAAVSVTLTPSTNSIVRTFFAVSLSKTLGMYSCLLCSKNLAVLLACFASLRKSSSMSMLARNSGMIQENSNAGNAQPITFTSSSIVRRSPVTSLESLGYWSLTATVSPVSRSFALCTCASEAAAMGSRSKSKNASSGVMFSSSLKTFSTSEKGTEGALSWRTESVVMYCFGRMLLSEAMCWPAFVKMPAFVLHSHRRRSADRWWVWSRTACQRFLSSCSSCIVISISPSRKAPAFFIR
mmetsp:Transcript_9105/g.37550  ORF Transcript_9105/g.37550 Transcript_9105/m.37550 type:complete len:263 (-) Transcript_9105:528-1316(-)